MLAAILFFTEIFILFFLSKGLQRRVFRFLYKFTKSKTWAIRLFSLIFLPGTFVHEMSHFLSSLFLLVPVGKLELLPEEIEGEGLKLGSVAIGKTDPLRRFLIGAAPVFAGTLIILFSIYYVYTGSLLSDPKFLLLLGYIIFEIGNTMFSSKKDLEGSVFFLICSASIIILLYLLGVRVSVETQNFSGFFNQAAIYMLAPIIIDLLLIIVL